MIHQARSIRQRYTPASTDSTAVSLSKRVMVGARAAGATVSALSLTGDGAACVRTMKPRFLGSRAHVVQPTLHGVPRLNPEVEVPEVGERLALVATSLSARELCGTNLQDARAVRVA